MSTRLRIGSQIFCLFLLFIYVPGTEYMYEWGNLPQQYPLKTQGGLLTKQSLVSFTALIGIGFGVFGFVKLRGKKGNNSIANPPNGQVDLHPTKTEDQDCDSRIPAVKRTAENNQPSKSSTENITYNRDRQQMILPAIQGYKIIDLNEIRYFEADGNYTKLHLQGGKHYVLSQTMSLIQETLPQEQFFRIHKSYLLNCYEVSGYENGRGGNIFLKDDTQLPIAVRRKSAFINHLKLHLTKKVSVKKRC